MALLDTHALCKEYRLSSGILIRALEEVSLAVERGSITLLTGPSGSGKTTLLALLGALDRPTRGTVRLEGVELTRCSDVELARVRRRMGFVFQDYALIPNLTAEENITYPLIPRRVPPAERRQRALELLQRFGMENRLRVRAGSLSGGEQQRVAVARALAGDPDVLLADEPTSSLDAETADFVCAVFQEFHHAGKTAILVSHDPRVVALATAVYSLRNGQLVPPPTAAPTASA